MSALLALFTMLAYLPIPVQPAWAASDVPGGADMTPPAYVLNDHTPYAIHFTMTGLPASTTFDVNVRLSKTGTSGGFTDARGFTWNQGLGRWVQTREGSNLFPAITTDASGNAQGWVYWKCGDETFTGFGSGLAGLGPNQGYLTVSLQTPTGGGTYNGTSKWVVTILNAATEGAWVHNGIATPAAAAKRAEALKSTDASTSYSLQKTEANLLDDDSNGTMDDEDFGAAGATGDFRFGVPTGTTMNIKLNQAAWVPGTGVSAGPADTDIAVGAADHTAPSAPSNVNPTAGDNSVSLQWSASSDSAGVTGYRIYRLVPGTYGDLTLQSALPKLVGTVDVGTTSFTDTSVVNGNSYDYYVRAIDAATNVSARSNKATVSLPMADSAAPAAIVDLTATSASAEHIDLAWTAPGDDGSVGTAAAYDIRYSTSPIVDEAGFTAAIPVGAATPSAAGTPEHLSVMGLLTGVTYYFAVKTVDDSGNWSALSNTASAAPLAVPSGTMWANNGAAYTNTTAVSVDSTVGGAVEMRARDAAGAWSDWTPFAAHMSLSLTAGDGVKTVEAEYRNAVGDVTSLADTITLDTVAPTGTVALSNGASYTTTRAVTINSVVTGAVEMRKRNADGGGNWSSWSPYAASVAQTVQSGDGVKHVDAEYRDAAGNVLSLSDTITLDTGLPVTTISGLPAGDNFGPVTFSLSASDSVSGVPGDAVKYVLDSVQPTSTYTTPVQVVTPGIHTLVYWSKDGAGNKESGKTATFVSGGRFEESDSRILYEGAWTAGTASGRSASAWRYTASAGAAANIAFNGTAIRLIASTAPDYGKALVTVDGGTPQIVDLYSAKILNQQNVFERLGLTPGPHTLRVEWAGQKNVASTGTRVNIDAADVAGGLTQAASPWSRFEETAAALAWEGTWTGGAATGRSGGAWRYASSLGAACNIAFDGTGVRLLSSMSPDYGKAWISLDGGTPQVVDLYAAKVLNQQIIYSRTALAPGPHTLRIDYTGMKNDLSTGTRVNVDALEVVGALTVAHTPWSRIEETSALYSWQGLWTSALSSARSGGSFRYSSAPGAYADATFSGTAVRLICSKAPDYGIALVSVDGDVAQAVDLYSATWLNQQVVIVKTGLAATAHTIRITYSGTKNAASTGTRVNVDAVDVIAP